MRTEVNPKILVWARESAGLTIADAAKKIGLTDAPNSTAEAKLKSLEDGSVKPSRIQLGKIAHVYYRSLVTFYLDNPPKIAARGEDFRTHTGDLSSRENAILDALLRDVRSRQRMVKAILSEDEDHTKLNFVGSMSIGDNVVKSARIIRNLLGVTSELLRKQPDTDASFRMLREKIETLGVFVLIAGDLGSYHTAIDTKLFRGFAIADNIAPFIVVNTQDANAAKTFTLIHELVHIFMGSTGISGAPVVLAATTQKLKMEKMKSQSR